MKGTIEAIPYQEVAAYQATNGIDFYGLPSGGTQTGGFVVSWDLDTGFSGDGWDWDNTDSPANGWTMAEIREAVSTDGNLNDMFKKWSERVDFPSRLNWITKWMNVNGCVTESSL